MGLCINWTVRAPADSSIEGVTAILHARREACLDLPFDAVTEVMSLEGEELLRRLNDRARWFLLQAAAAERESRQAVSVGSRREEGP